MRGKWRATSTVYGWSGVLLTLTWNVEGLWAESFKDEIRSSNFEDINRSLTYSLCHYLVNRNTLCTSNLPNIRELWSAQNLS